MFSKTFTLELDNREACIERFREHEADLVRRADPSRLIVWEAKDGWGPICEALNLPIPEAPFPKVNSTEEF